MARIFVCTDSRLAGLVDPVARALRDLGHEVVRGPAENASGMRQYSTDEIDTYFADVDVAVFTPRHACSRELMTRSARLRGVCSPVIGTESIDLEAANELGILIGHGAVPGNIIGMAEANVMLMLMLFYDVETNIRRLRGGQWRRPGHHGHQFEGKTVGLIGFGRIAREITRRLAGFGVRIITHSPRARPEDLPAGVEKVELETLLRDSDVVSIFTGLTAQTRNMIDAERLALMKPGAYLINADRGGIVNEAALFEALRLGKIAGAALDAFVTEPLPADSPLLEAPNLIMTPHCVGHTVECWDQFVPAVVENAQRMLQGQPPLYCKNPATEPAWRARLQRLN